MERNTELGISLLIISALILLLLVASQFQTLVQAIAEILLIASGSIATYGVKLLLEERSTLERNPYYRSTDNDLIRRVITTEVPEPNLSYLTIHYSRKNDNARNHHSPYYIVNSRTKKAYYVRAELIVLNSRAIIHSITHEGELGLKKYLHDTGIDLVRNYSELGDLV